MGAPEDQSSPVAITGVSRRTLFWATFVVVTIPFLGFFGQSLWLLRQNVSDLYRTSPAAVVMLLDNVGELKDEKQRLGFLSKAWVAMDHDRILHRHQIMDWAFTARTSTRLMSLIFGAILITTGSVFVLSRVTGPNTEANVQVDSMSLSFKSSSPGLVLAALGVILIVVPNVAKQRITFGEIPITRQRDVIPTPSVPAIQLEQDVLPEESQVYELLYELAPAAN